MDNQQGQLQFLEDLFQPLAYSVGAMIGDGCVRAYIHRGNQMRYQTTILGMGKEPIDRVCREINSILPGNYNVVRYINRHGTTMYRLWMGKKIIYDFFHVLIGNKITLPDEVFQSNRKSKLDFLAGLFDTDGTVAVSKQPGTKTGVRWKIMFAARHKSLVEDVARLLQQVNVKVGKITEYTKSGYRSTYTISPNIRSFIDAGCYFGSTRKAERLHDYLKAVLPSETMHAASLTKDDDIVRA